MAAAAGFLCAESLPAGPGNESSVSMPRSHREYDYFLQTKRVEQTRPAEKALMDWFSLVYSDRANSSETQRAKK